MANTNIAVIIGRLTKDAELSYTPSGMAIAQLSIALNRRVKKGDIWEDEPNYFDVKLFGKQAESLKLYLTKGKQVAITGFLRQERWQAQDGSQRSKVVINANDIELLGATSDRPNYDTQQPESNGYDGGYGYGY